ncbi:MAG: RdgB/HAM1 family non-canonical purine NTP pyrophosphatase [Pegethrix bostrychoides GSE-TBD4-15B]|jgi:XTP/dITP diphosphohydrolase|uniref:dITP/XTP pyrophosphatase n=1 Tax=Pegethrix bostrychoides GSE-TBD4-15B TaxID=2839662 RepID=A0A951P7T9_9CYAN|nr:RdgB/HAM1 family non-canonical purine NTP pyrophosphatase [Pegethrix bostrychoides GSE-TBD4-15B]
MPNLIVATSNPGKILEIQPYLASRLPDWRLQLKPQELEIAETGSTFLENACLKAAQVAAALSEWAIADDSGLCIDALDGAPGIYSARYAATPQACIDRVLSELKGSANRKAHFTCALAVARPDGSIALQTAGICPGEILESPSGAGGFGYDPIFYLPDYQSSFAEMSVELKNQVSHRGRAFQQLVPNLVELLERSP